MMTLTKGPSIKYARSRGKERVQAKAYIYCLYDVMLLFKKAQGTGGKGVSENHQIYAYVLYGWS